MKKLLGIFFKCLREILKLTGHDKIKAIVNLNCFSKFEAEYTVNG